MARKTNLDIRGYAASKGVRLGDIAEAMGITQSAFSVEYMRHEMTEADKDHMRAVIDRIIGGEENGR